MEDAVKDTLRVDNIQGWGGFWYLASPYSKHPDGIEEAAHEAAAAAAWLAKQGIRVLAPTAYTHELCKHGIDPMWTDFWYPFDEPFMRAAVGLIVCMMPSWDESVGVKREITSFIEQGKPIYYMEWPR
jgi:hypothetical protein